MAACLHWHTIWIRALLKGWNLSTFAEIMRRFLHQHVPSSVKRNPLVTNQTIHCYIMYAITNTTNKLLGFPSIQLLVLRQGILGIWTIPSWSYITHSDVIILVESQLLFKLAISQPTFIYTTHMHKDGRDKNSSNVLHAFPTVQCFRLCESKYAHCSTIVMSLWILVVMVDKAI